MNQIMSWGWSPDVPWLSFPPTGWGDRGGWAKVRFDSLWQHVAATHAEAVPEDDLCRETARTSYFALVNQELSTAKVAQKVGNYSETTSSGGRRISQHPSGFRQWLFLVCESRVALLSLPEFLFWEDHPFEENFRQAGNPLRKRDKEARRGVWFGWFGSLTVCPMRSFRDFVRHGFLCSEKCMVDIRTANPTMPLACPCIGGYLA